MKAATAYERKGQVYIHSLSKTVTGMWIFSEPVLMHPVEDTDRIGQSLRIALDSMKENVPHPTNWGTLTAPLLNRSGVGSYNTFAKSAKCVEVRSENGMIVLTPTRNGGTNTGFAHLNEKKIEISEASESLGEKLKMAFALCE
jgi:hypothetical protein